MTEKEFQSQVIALARLRGWLAYHTHDSRRSAKGFPDLVLCRVRNNAGRVIFAELKVGRNECTPEQRQWIAALLSAEVAAFVWRPEMWPDIERILE